MEADQHWCLTCGTAAPGSLGDRPGWRAASTVIALTVLLVLGAIGAGYAALTGDSQPKAAAPPQAQAQVTPPAVTPPATTPPAATQAQPTTPTQPATPKKLPKVKTPPTGPTQGSPVTPVTPTPSTPSPSAGTGTATGTGTGTGTGTAPADDTTTAPADTGPQAIDLNGDAGTIYDPYGRVKASGEATRALDGDATTSWYVDPKDPQQVAVGYAVDLGKLQGVREIQLQTPTTGFRIEVYATDETELPPDILDTRWSHIKDVSNVGAKHDGKQTIVLGAGTSKYRNVLLWFTQPPTDGPRLRLTELKLLG
jgi:hypothetical protein